MMGIHWDWGEPPDPKFCQLLVTIAKREKWAVEHGLLAAKIAALTARALTFPEVKVERIAIAGLLHDVGKLTIPAQLLQKPRPLTEEEYSQVQRHPSTGARITAALHLPLETIEAIRHHHERMDGKGYPFGKVGDEIPIEGRIAAVAETLSAALTPRWYRPPLSPAFALERLKDSAGKILDRDLVKAFSSQFPKLFGFSSLTSLSLCTKPFPLERLVGEEEASLWISISTFISKLLAEMERLMGRQFCQNFVEWLNNWLDSHQIPLQFQGLKPISKHRWWQTIGEFALFARTLIGAIHAMLGHLVGSDFVADWLDGVRAQLTEQADTVGIRYGLWIWQRNLNLVAVKSQ